MDNWNSNSQGTSGQQPQQSQWGDQNQSSGWNSVPPMGQAQQTQWGEQTSQAQWGSNTQQSSFGDRVGATIDSAAQQASQAAREGFNAFENSFDGTAVNLSFINDTGMLGVKYLLYMFFACLCVATNQVSGLIIFTCFVAFVEKRLEVTKILMVLCCTLIGFLFAYYVTEYIPDIVTSPLSFLKSTFSGVKIIYAPLNFLYSIINFVTNYAGYIITALRIIVAYKSFKSIKNGTFKVPKFVEKYM